MRAGPAVEEEVEIVAWEAGGVGVEEGHYMRGERCVAGGHRMSRKVVSNL